MKTAGLVLDFYDDQSGEVLKRAFPKAEDLPESVKTAHILLPEEREVLRDEAYALILHNEGQQLRKFACVDKGNTFLSMLYYVENKDKLPEEAQKIACVNLEAFAREFGLIDEQGELVEKVAAAKPVKKASAMSRKRDTFNQPTVGDEADWAQRTNLSSAPAGADAGRVSDTVSTPKIASASKSEPKKLSTKQVVGTTVGALGAVGAGGYAAHKLLQAHKDKAVKGATKLLKHANIVDVSGLEAPIMIKRASAQRYAVDGRYPLDSYVDVQKAIEYFDNCWTEMAPETRHTFAVKTAARADELGIKIASELMNRYGSTEYAPDVDAHLVSRARALPAERKVYDELRTKTASVKPEEFVQMLKEADEKTGLNFYWGGDVTDPYLATFGGRSEKEKKAGWSWHDGELALTEDQLFGIPVEKIEQTFNSDVSGAFANDPVQIFDSMPREQKIIIAKLAQ